ncbi:hypothetical protein MMSR116_29535 [Methylobacterium mesophilicum SR1.6/6]|uniref:Uncharacterized protein n=1 Tax=Methylobacterium mesophilicum SR1.6/6 TaxID=908290 RepID=A0A6B9FYN6_9HYPH|nr:hypothetical protein [Methylobacterium mesophilicum]QGY05578.1 hypothetical protein MMSR116_29535 [Methylobacterium mesophilicum SR1.6/6]
MTAPQVIATVFFLVSLGSVLMLALLTVLSAALEAVGTACRAGHAIRSHPLKAAACRAHRTARARFDLHSARRQHSITVPEVFQDTSTLKA